MKFSSSTESQAYLAKHAPHYLSYCRELDSEVTIVPLDCVVRHIHPSQKLSTMLEKGDDVEVATIATALISRSGVRLDELGITGSYLVDAQGATSDIDLVVYGFENYPKLLAALLEGVEEGVFGLPSDEDWRRIYEKRCLDPETYPFADFVWHESRKYNRAKLGSRRFDILFARKEEEVTGRFGSVVYKKLSKTSAQCTVSDASLGFDYPARYSVSGQTADGIAVSEVASYTHTFVDQARPGETITCSGVLEEVSGKGTCHRILVGSSRECPGEYIKVQRREEPSPQS